MANTVRSKSSDAAAVDLVRRVRQQFEDSAQTKLKAVRQKLGRMGWQTRDPEEGSR